MDAIKSGDKKNLKDELNEILSQISWKLDYSILNIIGIFKECQNSMTYLAVTWEPYLDLMCPKSHGIL